MNSFKIQLNWSDLASDEDGFEIEKLLWNEKWLPISIVGPNVTTYTDTKGVEPLKEYRYRVRAFRGTEKSPYSNEALVSYTKDGNTINCTINGFEGIHSDIVPILVEMLKAGGFDGNVNFSGD